MHSKIAHGHSAAFQSQQPCYTLLEKRTGVGMANTRFRQVMVWPPTLLGASIDGFFYEGNNTAKLDILHGALNWKTTFWSKSRTTEDHFQITSRSQRQEDHQSTSVLSRKSQHHSNSWLSRWDTSYTALLLNSTENQQLLQCETRYQHFSL